MKNIQRDPDWIDRALGIFAAVLVVFFIIMITGCGKSPDLVYDTDQCLEQDKRAVMICPRYVDRCFIECREKKDGG